MRRLFIAATGAIAALLTTQALAAPVTEGGRRVIAPFSGTSEVPGPGDADAAGTAQITVNPDQKRICYMLTASGIAQATEARIYEGASGRTGEPVVTLDTPDAGGGSMGCVKIDESLARKIYQNPSGYYVGITNAEYPQGAARAQLTP